MNKGYVLLIALLFSTLSALADNDVRFSQESFTLASTTLPYRKAEIAHAAGTTPLMLLYLHGGTARGNDNEAQLNEAGVDVIYNYLQSRHMAATIIVPQCPSGGGWTGTYRRVVNELVRSYLTANLADSDRVYVVGGSMGGTGTWCQLSYFPDFYAAAIPVAGNPTGFNAETIAQTPVYAVMGDSDALMSVLPVSDLMNQVIQLGGTMFLDIEVGWTHQNTCEMSYTDKRLGWLFAQTKKGCPTGVGKICNLSDDQKEYYTIQGTKVDRPTTGFFLIKTGGEVRKIFVR